MKESVVVGLGDNQPAGTAKSLCNFKGSVPAFPAWEGGFVFKIKPFALMTQHPAEMSRLPKQLRERLPADKKVDYHSTQLFRRNVRQLRRRRPLLGSKPRDR